MNKKIKIAVTGAAGHIGYGLLFRLASGAVFGKDVTIDLHLLEIEPALPALEGVAMELADCAFPTLGRVLLTAKPQEAFAGVHWAILVGSVPRKAGMERSDLLSLNGKIFTTQGQAINDHAADDVRVLVVGNPCNTNCMIAMHNAQDVPNDRFFAMTSLDENRAKSLLAAKAGVAVGEIRNMIIWGNHSATQYPDFYHAHIGQQAVLEAIHDEHWLQTNFIQTVQQRGAAVIKARGASSAASAANGIITSLCALHEDTLPQNSYSIARCSQGEYGVDAGLIYSFPSRTVQGRSEIITGISHNNAFAQQRLQLTLEELRQERDAVKAMALIDA